MMPSANTSLSLILVALGILGIILSFLVPERKKSLLSLILALIIVAAGVFQYTRQTLNQNRWRKRMSTMQPDRRVNFEELRSKLKAEAEEARKKVDNPTAK